MEALVARCRRCGRFIRREQTLCGSCARAQMWSVAQRISYALGAGLALLALALFLGGGAGLRESAAAGSELDPDPASARAVEVRPIPVEVIKEVPVAEAEVAKAFALAGELRKQLGEWEEWYRLPAGDFQALVQRVEELAGLLQAAVYEMRLLNEPEGAGSDE